MVARILAGLTSRFRALRLRSRGVSIAGPVWLRAIEVPRQAHRISLQPRVALDRGITLLVSGDPAAGMALRIGAESYINRHTIIDASESIEIGESCMIGPFCYITDHDHVFDASGRLGTGLHSRPVRIGAGCWIGAHVSILKGVTIGAGAIIGAGAVVTRDVAPGTTVVGNPARPLPARSRPS